MGTKLTIFTKLPILKGQELNTRPVHRGAGILEVTSEFSLPHSIFSKAVKDAFNF